jgi:hypothetical protein
MKLTGKCKEDFEKWLLDNFRKYGVTPPDCETHSGDEIDFICHYSIYEDFFDSVDILIEIMPYESKSFYWIINDNQMNSGETDTRPQARLESIKEVNKIYNEK